MKEKPKNTHQPWVDPDDVPELTGDFFKNGVWRIGDKVVFRQEAQAAVVKKMDRPPIASPKKAIKIRLVADYSVPSRPPERDGDPH